MLKIFPVLTPAYSQLAFTFPKLTNRNTRKRCEIRLKLAIKTSERRYRRRSGVFIVNSEYISHLDLVFLLLTLNMYLFTLLICTHPNITRIKSNFFTSVALPLKMFMNLVLQSISNKFEPTQLTFTCSTSTTEKGAKYVQI